MMTATYPRFTSNIEVGESLQLADEFHDISGDPAPSLHDDGLVIENYAHDSSSQNVRERWVRCEGESADRIGLVWRTAAFVQLSRHRRGHYVAHGHSWAIRRPSGAIGRAFLAGGIARVLSLVLQVGSIAITTRTLGVDAFGLLALLLGSLSLFSFLDLGIGNASLSRLSAELKRHDLAAARETLGSAVVALVIAATLMGAMLSSVVILAPARWLPAATGVSVGTVRVALIVYVLSIALTIVTSTGSRLSLALEHGTLNAWYAAIAAVATSVLCLLGALVHGGLVYFSVACVAVSPLSQAAQTLWLARQHPDLFAGWVVNFRQILGFLKAGLPFMVLALGAVATYQTDSLIIQYSLGSGALAGFGVTMRLFGIVTSLYAAGLQQVWATLAGAFALGDFERSRRIVRGVIVGILTTGVPLTALLVLVGRPVIGTWAGPDYRPSIALLAVVGTWSIYNLVMSVLSFALNAANLVWRQAFWAILMASISLPLSLILVNIVGSPGPVLATLVSHLLVIAIPSIISVRKLLGGRR